jgi:ArsR family transcriptional regulator
MSDPFAALSHPARRKILSLLARDGEMTAGELSREFSFSKPTLSAHLSKLQASNLVASRKEVNKRIYRLNLSVLESLTRKVLDIYKLGEENE